MLVLRVCELVVICFLILVDSNSRIEKKNPLTNYVCHLPSALFIFYSSALRYVNSCRSAVILNKRKLINVNISKRFENEKSNKDGNIHIRE